MLTELGDHVFGDGGEPLAGELAQAGERVDVAVLAPTRRLNPIAHTNIYTNTHPYAQGENAI